METIDMCIIASVLLVLICWIAFVWSVNGRSFVCKILGHKWVVWEDHPSEWIKWYKCDRCGGIK